MQSGKINKIWELLNTVPDPEIPVISVVELGVIRDVIFSKILTLSPLPLLTQAVQRLKHFRMILKYVLKKME